MGPTRKTKAGGKRTALAFACVLVAFPTFAQASPFWYPISEDKKCPGGSVCDTRWPEVTGNNASGGGVKVGGTPTSNPYSPSSCAPEPPKAPCRDIAYGLMNIDPDNPSNYQKYNLTDQGPVSGWPKERHAAFNAAQAQWRKDTIMKAKQAGACALEGDNSDNPHESIDSRAKLLNGECAFLKSVGMSCTLKNNREVLEKLDHVPDIWIIEAGGNAGNAGSNGGDKNIREAAQQSKIPPQNIFIVYYGAPDQKVCDLLPGAHFVFAPSGHLHMAGQKPCPNDSGGNGSGGPQASGSGSSSGTGQQLAGRCNPQNPTPPPPAEDPMPQPDQPAAYPTFAASPPSAGPTADSGTAPAGIHPWRPAPPGREKTYDSSTVMPRAPGNGETGTDAGASPGSPGHENAWYPVLRGTSVSNSAGRNASGSSGTKKTLPKAAGGGIFITGIEGASNKAARNPASADAGPGAKKGSEATAEVLSSFTPKRMSAEKSPTNGQEGKPSDPTLLADYIGKGSLAGSGPEQMVAEEITLFSMVHDAHVRSLAGGRLTGERLRR